MKINLGDLYSDLSVPWDEDITIGEIEDIKDRAAHIVSLLDDWASAKRAFRKGGDREELLNAEFELFWCVK